MSEIIRNMARNALNACGRDRNEARPLFKQWLRENDDLLEAIAGPAITSAINSALTADITIERNDVVKRERAMPTLGDTRPPAGPCLPVPSREADDRRAARVAAHGFKMSGLFEFPLPVTGKLLGEAKAWEVHEASLWYQSNARGHLARAQFLAFVWQAAPDREKPASAQQPVSRHMDVETLRLLDRKAVAESEKPLLQAVAQ